VSSSKKVWIAVGALSLLLMGLVGAGLSQVSRASLACGLKRGRLLPLATYSIPSASMTPTIMRGDYVMAELCAFVDHPPTRGDLVIFRIPAGNENYVKRIVALPGDRVQLRAGILYLNDTAVQRERVGDYRLPDSGETLAEYRETLLGGRAYMIVETSDDGPRDNTDAVLVPSGSVFVIGDNRDRSQDSRDFGPVPFDRLEDEPFLIYWSRDPARIGRGVQ